MRYRRNYESGGCYFFTVVTADRRPWLGEAANVAMLRQALRHVRTNHPFTIEAMVVLPDHLHTIWTLPPDDAAFSMRWRLIKTYLKKYGHEPEPLWQRRFWEHTIRDARDYANHMDYIHYNPVKHGLAKRPDEWRYSSFRRCVKQGVYAAHWGQTPPELPLTIGHE